MLHSLRRRIALMICPELRAEQGESPAGCHVTPEHLCRLTEAYARARNRSVKTVSRLATGSGDTVERLRDGKRITTQRAARALQWLSDHWPEGEPWPGDIPRPAANNRRAA